MVDKVSGVLAGLYAWSELIWKYSTFFFAFGGITRCGSASLKLCVCDAALPWSQRPLPDSQCLQNRAFSPTLGKSLLKRCNLKTLWSFFLHACFCEKIVNWHQTHFFYECWNKILKKHFAEKIHSVFEGLKEGPFEHTKTLFRKMVSIFSQCW